MSILRLLPHSRLNMFINEVQERKKEMKKEEDGRWITVKGRHVLLKEGEKLDFNKVVNDHYDKEKEEKERMEIAKEIAREIHGKGLSDTVAERYAKDIMEYHEGDEIEDDEETYEGKNGIELSTNALKEWYEDLKLDTAKDINDTPYSKGLSEEKQLEEATRKAAASAYIDTYRKVKNMRDVVKTVKNEESKQEKMKQLREIEANAEDFWRYELH